MGDYMNENSKTRLINKEVINVRDGCKIGCVSDVLVDSKDGNICSIIVPVVNGIFSFFGKKREYCISWCDIVKIGTDIVLIDTDARNCVRICEG